MDALESFRKERQCTERKEQRWDIGSTARRQYFCSKGGGCKFAFIAIIPPPAELSAKNSIQLYEKSTHTHPEKHSGPRSNAKTKILLEEVCSPEEVDLRAKSLRVDSCHKKSDTTLRYRCLGCPLLLTAYPTPTGTYKLYVSSREHAEDCTLSPDGKRRRTRNVRGECSLL